VQGRTGEEFHALAGQAQEFSNPTDLRRTTYTHGVVNRLCWAGMCSTSTSSLFSRIIFRSLLAVCLPLLAISAAYSQVPVWPKTTPAEVTASGIGVQLTGADYGHGVFVLAAYFGGTTAVPAVTPAVYTSPDGTTWTRRTLPVTGARVGKPRFLNGMFFLGMDAATNGNGVPTGTNGAVLTSPDGITWTAVTLSAPLYGPFSFSYGNGVYVAPVSGVTASTFQVLTSADGVTWIPRSIGGGASFVSSVTFFNNKFYTADFNAGLFSSADGTSWSKVSSAPAGPNIVASTSSTLLVTIPPTTTGGTIQRQSLTADGTTFITASPGQPLVFDTLPTVNGVFSTIVPINSSNSNNTEVMTSPDGNNWTKIATAANQYSAADLAYGGGRWVFVGEFDSFSGTTTVSTGGGGAGAPAITTQPASQTVAIGSGVTFSVTVTGTGLSYQWYFNGIAITGEINVNLILSAITAAQAGNYTVKITNANGSVTSSTATLTVATASNVGRIVNMSVRTGAGNGSQSLIVGFVLGGTGTSGNTSLLVRAVGPSLGAFGVPNFITDPSLTAYANGVVVATNDNWSGDAAISAASSRLGAFALASAQSKDAAIFASPQSGVYSAVVSGPTSGVALAEIYDASTTFTASTPRLLNVSARAQVGTGNDVLIAGFVIGGSTSRSVLVRAIGPTLTGFGVTGALADPKVTLFAGSNKLAENDNWSDATNAAAVATASATVGAFALAPGTKDAALLITLPPGVYTAQVSGVSSTTGVGLVEIYEAP
jgi:hypothetical protein